MERCPWAIKFGITLATRCMREAGHGVDQQGDMMHEGRGLAEFPYQRIDWLPGDRREFQTDRDDKQSWET